VFFFGIVSFGPVFFGIVYGLFLFFGNISGLHKNMNILVNTFAFEVF